ncbi:MULTISPECIES: hypothetical protein [Blautia]|uniref:hypothetical protein n=1 Tax=Blautia TaxID=572511 RepID=UPI0011CAF9DF|nr:MULTISPECIES: hypothetical protein [Blautia]
METKLEKQGFYPTELEVANIYQTDREISIKMFARFKSCTCPKCGTVSEHPHGTYEKRFRISQSSGEPSASL